MMVIKEPVFSIITPTHNRSNLLKRCIRSVFAQTFGNYEHIIIIDGNDPDTERMVRSFDDKKIVIIKHDQQSGAAASYNSGIRNSKGELVTFLDDDDEYLPGYLDTVFRFFKEDKDKTDFIWTGIEKVRDDKDGEKLYQSIIWTYPFKSKEDGFIKATSIGNGYGVCIRRECLNKVGLYDASLKVSSDTDYLFRLAMYFNFKVLSTILVKIHVHDDLQLTDFQNDQARIECYNEILNRNKICLQKYSGLYVIHYQSLARIYYRLGDKLNGRRLMFSILKRKPFKLKTYPVFIAYEFLGEKFTATRVGNFLSRVFR